MIALMTSTSIIFYRTYFLNNSKKDVEVNNKTENKIVENIEENKNIIENFEYSVKNLKRTFHPFPFLQCLDKKALS